MLAFARKRAPKATFIEADAQNLPFDDAEFDIVVSNLGICHVPDQQRALAETRRVVRPGGRFAMTVWCGPDISPCFEIVYAAIKAHGSPDVSAPPGPDFHQFARRDVAIKFLSGAGLPMSILRLLIAHGTSLRRKSYLRFMRSERSVRQCLLANQPPQNFRAIRSDLTQKCTSDSQVKALAYSRSRDNATCDRLAPRQ